MKITQESFSKRWIAYFDILGFRTLVQKENPLTILSIYDEAVLQAKRQIEFPQSAGDEIRFGYFSDTFFFYSDDDSGRAYTWVQSIAKNFIRQCLVGEPFIPIRGAIACDEFYVDSLRNIYFGKALVEAYEWAESQDWIGLVLTKSALTKIREFDLDPSRHQFCLIDIPINKKHSVKDLESKSFAYNFHAEMINPANLINVLIFQEESVSVDIRPKYRNTIDYLLGISHQAMV